MAITSGLTVNNNAVAQGGLHETLTLVAEGVITPGDAVKFGSTNEFVVVCGVTDPLFLGVADKNDKEANEVGNNPMTDDYAVGDQVLVFTKGRVRVLADSAVAVTRGTKVMTGATVATSFQDIGAGTFDEVAGKALTSAGVGVAFILDIQ